MDHELIQNAEKYNKRHRRRKIWQKVVSILGCAVVFCTTYALILPAITQERESFCGYEEHTHDESCFTKVEEAGESVLSCSYESLGVHVHVADCYDAEGSVLCGETDYVVHTHDASCCDADGNTMCVLPEVSAHVHTEVCYGTEGGHTHGEDCYEKQQGELTCELPEEEGHAHGEGCYVSGETLLCTTTENHVHEDGCYIVGALICTVEENHTHGEDCRQTALTCELPEDESHTHDENCSTQTLICTQPEGHAHNESCSEQVLACEVPEGHVHEADCYEQVLQCEMPESEGHTHTEDCYEKILTLTCTAEETPGEQVLVCTEPEVPVHVHEETCFRTVAEEDILTCTLEENEEHTHSTLCWGTWKLTCTLEEHKHELPCYSDPEADVETAADWEATFAGAELTGKWREDVLTIAKTQLGYKESTRNYEVLEDGETIRGYTRYGRWYGDPYGDWCAMFVSFCLHYAEVENMPLSGSCQTWIETLSQEEYDAYRAVGAYVPNPGDLIFFDWNQDGNAEHVGLVETVMAEEESEVVQLSVIEGNSTEQVQRVEYAMDDPAILGFGLLPPQLTEEEQAQVDNVIAMIDAMPSADEIDAKIEEFEAAEDYEGEEAWLTETYQQVAEAYYYYSLLTEDQKRCVTNADKLLELEYIWSVTPYLDEIVSAKPTTVGKTGSDPVASTSEFVKLNIYDYYGSASASSAGKTNINTLWTSNKEYPGFQWNGGAYMQSSTFSRSSVDNIDFGNSVITDFTYGSVGSTVTNGYSANRQMIGNKGGTINQVIGYTNQPIGYSSGTDYDALQHTLVNGYPALSNGTSLNYLFSESSYASKKNTDNIDGLFRQNQTSGEYWFDSRENHAQYGNNKFTLYNQIITPNFILYPFGNFLPFNDITNSDKATQVSAINYVVQSGDNGVSAGYMQTIINRLLEGDEDSTQNQLVDMLAKYRNSLSDTQGVTGSRFTWTVEEALVDYFSNSSEFGGDLDYEALFKSTEGQNLLAKLYNIDYDVAKNFLFGMDMEMNFMQPKNGLTGNDTDNDGIPNYDMKFYFAGDDDVWVFIDGVLFLDLTGIHRHVGGDIDFVNGKVNYYMMDSYIDGAVESTPYKTMTFAEILTDIGGVAEADLGNYLKTDASGNYTTFKDYTNHNFKFYYMERGTGSSVCRLNFNFPLLRQNSISVSKEVSADTTIAGQPDYKFQVLMANSDGTKTNNLFIAAGTSYTIYDANDNKIGTGTTDANGVFTLKAGQRAEFTGIKENAGKYYVRELLEGTVLEQYGNVTVSGESTTKSGNVTVGSDTFTGMDSPVKDMSDGATAFRFTNDVDENKLGTLSISKVLTEYPQARVTKYFDIEVTLDGEKLPVGTKYTVGGETREVTAEGIITIAADETATLSNILAGTQFTVQETSGSAEGYTVTYNDSGGYTITVNDGVVTGVIKSSAEVKLVVTNSEKGATVTIPGTKTLSNPDGGEHEYIFELNEVTDSIGDTLKSGGLTGYTATAVVKDTTAVGFDFTINYAQVDYASLPQTHYYRITEQGAENTLANTTMYVVEVTVSETTDGIAAAITGMWKAGEAITDSGGYRADFVNTLVGDLTLSKTVSGGSTADNEKLFQFDITCTGLTGEIAAIKTNDITGTSETVKVMFTDGKAAVSLKHGESLTIPDIPYGTAWTVMETNADGYMVSNTVTENGGEPVTGEEMQTNGTIPVGGVTVAYTNTVGYELPETGGAGTHLYTAGGLLLTAAAGLLLMYNHKKRRKEDSASS